MDKQYFGQGDKVRCKEFDGKPLTGIVAGWGVIADQRGTLSPLYLIQLDDGFWSEDKNTFVSVLVCHYGNVQAA